MRISDWSSDVCSSDLLAGEAFQRALLRAVARRPAPVALSGQRGELHVPVEVEMRVLLPGRTRRGVDRLLPEARVGQEALFDDALEPLQRHQIGRAHV